MNITFMLAVFCLLDLSVTVRSRENLNVLVPNNDVNLHNKMKTLLDDLDPEDFNDNEIESINFIKNPKVTKLRTQNFQSLNRVIDDKNRNVEENQIDREGPMMDSESNVTTSVPHMNVTELPSIPTIPYNITTPTQVLTTNTPNNTWLSTTVQTTEQSNNSWTNTTIGNTWAPTTISFNFTTPSSPEISTIFPSTTEEQIFDDLQSDECLLGKAERHLNWVNVTGRLNTIFIDYDKSIDFSRSFNGHQDYLRFETNNLTNDLVRANFTNLKFLSMAFNNLKDLPTLMLAISNATLEYLSLTGNNFSQEFRFDSMAVLKQLDMRRCQIKVIAEYFKNLQNLEFLFLSNNFISELIANPFPNKLIHLDLSYNDDQPARLQMAHKVFENLSQLDTLDLSFTKIREESVGALKFLPKNLERLSVCNTELPKLTEVFIAGSENIKYLDISKNPLLELRPSMFLNFSDSLLVLFARESNLRNLEWATPLKSLKLFDLFDNNIHRVTKTSFSHMASLTKLNLEKNSIGNWYERLFTQNQKLRILNLRENKLNLLTSDMKTDLSSVEFLALGKNEFECNCILQDFMHALFDATRNANSSNSDLFESMNEPDSFHEESFELNEIGEQATKVAHEYDVFSRTFKKYFEMAEESIQALKTRTAGELHLIARTSVGRQQSGGGFRTILFDYDGNDKDYQCMNASMSVEQPIIDLTDLCDFSEEIKKLSMAAIFWISFFSLFTTAALLLLLYWKWWYIKYFFVLCRNTAILTFMDSDSETEKIIKGKFDDVVDTFSYDVFVSYSEQNRQWVLDEFLPNVEKRETINVCLHERDFQVGYGILENIVTCMDRSRCLLLLISETFLLSQWCQFEMNLAQHRLLETRREKLILVLLQDIPVDKQPKTLKYLMRTKTYIKWPEHGSSDEKQLFWKRLKKAIVSSKWENENYGSNA